jgi:hypothetical protein
MCHYEILPSNFRSLSVPAPRMEIGELALEGWEPVFCQLGFVMWFVEESRLQNKGMQLTTINS